MSKKESEAKIDLKRNTDAFKQKLVKRKSAAAELRVQGKITDQNGQPLSGLTVAAFDMNVGVADIQLGEATSDFLGQYAIDYNPGQLNGKANADIVLRIYQDKHLMLTSDVIFNAGTLETKDFVLSITPNPEFQDLLASIQPLIRNKTDL